MARSPRTFTPKKAGEEIGASADTIRRYCQLYRRHLSEGATPSPGKPRVLTTIDVYLLKLAKQATEAGSTIEEVDSLLASVALPEDLVVGEEAGEGETLPTVAGSTEAPEAVALLRQMAATLERLASQGDRLAALEDQVVAKEARLAALEGEVGDLRRAVEVATSSPPAPAVETRKSPTWSAYVPYLIGVGVVALLIVTVAAVVALLR